mmetsp:Transcript_30492/g.89148  ORF Transcript_30492/g.89148 Transcript_30492/m.89148 type:complete len:200 (-) Transcript_30492:861-1460(-)
MLAIEPTDFHPHFIPSRGCRIFIRCLILQFDDVFFGSVFLPDTDDFRRAPRGGEGKLGTITDVATDVKMNSDRIANTDRPDVIFIAIFRRLAVLRRVVIVGWIDMELGVVTPGRCDVYVKGRCRCPSLVGIIIDLLVAALVTVHFSLITLSTAPSIVISGWTAHFACFLLCRRHLSSFCSLLLGCIVMVMFDIGLHILL